MIGNVYDCVGTTLFNPQLKLCQDGYNCTSASTDSTSTSLLTTLSESTTQTIQDTTSTTSAAFDANVFCASNAYGYYEYPSANTSYVYCHVFNDIMIGTVYECPGTTTFNIQLKYCA
jgi:hypothetical protein